MSPSPWIPLIQLNGLSRNAPHGVVVEEVPVVVLEHEGEFSVFQGHCPHEGSDLALGILKDGKLTCSAHGWTFDAHNGEKHQSPKVCLRRFETELRNGWIWVNREEIRTWREKQLPLNSRRTSIRRDIRALPGPKGLPLLGNLHQLNPAQMPEILGSWCDQFGPIFRFRILGKSFAVFAQLDSVLKILKERPGKFRRFGSFESSFRELGVDGMFSAEGDQWRRHNTLTKPAFQASHLQTFFSTLVEVTRRLERVWTTAFSSAQDVQVRPDLTRFTVDVTTNLAFGYDMDTLGGKNETLRETLEQIFPTLARRVTAPFPYWRYIRLPKDRAVDRACIEIEKVLEGFISGTRKRLAERPELRKKPTNFLEGWIAASESNAYAMTDSELTGNVMTILVAGEDTTANTIAWLLHHISSRPEIQSKMREEVQNVLGDRSVPTTFEDTSKLKYLDAVILESLRYQPVVPFLFVEPTEDTEVDGVVLPKGTPVVALTGHCGKNPLYFSSPDVFRPERWLTPPVGKEKHTPRALMAFGEGPRFCPGRSLAMLEIKIAVAMILQKFDLSPPKNGVVPHPENKFVVMVEDLWLHLTPRTYAKSERKPT